MKLISYLSQVVFILASFPLMLAAAELKVREDYRYQKPFEELTQAEHTQAKRTARTVKIRPLVACADPGNMPMSNMKGEGYDNRIIKLLAETMGTSVTFFWRPYLERGIVRETFSNKECDILLGIPEGYTDILTTMPIYRSAYVFASKQDSNIHIKDLDDPLLRKLKVGTYQHSGLREALSFHGLTDIFIHVIRQDTDLVEEHQQWQQVQQVVDGKIDLAGVWGPFAGYVKTKRGEDIVIQPVNMMEDRTPLEFSLGIGMRTTDVILKYALDEAIKANAAEIEKILAEYGVPLVSCSSCAVQGNLPSHGSYYQRFINEAKKRYLENLPQTQIELDRSQASADQIVDVDRLQNWLEQGAELNEELANAVLATDQERIKLLLAKGADINYLNSQGSGLLHAAARYRDAETLALLLNLGADPNVADRNGWTPLMQATYANHVPSLQQLIAAKADLEIEEKAGMTALAIALGEKKFWAAKQLIAAGSDVQHAVGAKKITPLMLIAMHKKSKNRDRNLIEGAEPVDIVKLLLARGAEVNAATTLGETALMFAAAHDNSPVIALLMQQGADHQIVSKAGKTALDFAKEHRHEAAEKSLILFASLR